MRLLITGATGALGGYLLRHMAGMDFHIRAWSGVRTGELFGIPIQPVDLADADGVTRAFREDRPDVVIHTAAISSVAECHREPERARRINTRASALLAALAEEAGTRLVHVSTDMVFDGERGWYDEQDSPSPLSVYGQSKAEAEQAVLAHRRCAVARVSLLFGPTLTGRGSFFDHLVQALVSGRSVTCFEDEWRTPLSLSAAAAALVTLAGSDCEGLLHIGGPLRLSRLEMGIRLAEYLKVDLSLVVPGKRAQASAPERRPRDLSLKSSKWRGLFPVQLWPTIEEALAAMR
jgi:dTDP-4-dehydrorhamnose reductase